MSSVCLNDRCWAVTHKSYAYIMKLRVPLIVSVDVEQYWGKDISLGQVIPRVA